MATIRRAAFECGRNISVEDYSPTEFEGFQNSRFPVASLLPLSLPQLFDNRCIFVDADTLILGDICELNSIDTGMKPIGACLDSFLLDVEERLFRLRASDFIRPTRSRRIKERLITRMVNMGIGLGQPVFNSGVLVVDCKAIQEEWGGKSMIDIKVFPAFMRDCPDQDYFNWLFKDNWFELPLCWNVPPNIDDISNMVLERNSVSATVRKRYVDQVKEAGRAPKLWHYVGNRKPWQKNRTAFSNRCRAVMDWRIVAAEFTEQTGISNQFAGV